MLITLHPNSCTFSTLYHFIHHIQSYYDVPTSLQCATLLISSDLFLFSTLNLIKFSAVTVDSNDLCSLPHNLQYYYNAK